MHWTKPKRNCKPRIAPGHMNSLHRKSLNINLLSCPTDGMRYLISGPMNLYWLNLLYYYYYYFGWIYFNNTITLQAYVSFNFLEAIKTTLRHSYLISEPNLTEPSQSSYTNDFRKGITSSNQWWCLLWPPAEYRHSAIEKPKPKPEDISSWRNNIAIGSFYLPQHTCTFARELSGSKDKWIPECLGSFLRTGSPARVLVTMWLTSKRVSWSPDRSCFGPSGLQCSAGGGVSPAQGLMHAYGWASKSKAASTFPGEACL